MLRPGRARRDLDVDADDPLDVGDQLGQRHAEPVAQRLQLAAQPVEAAEALGRVAAGGAEIVERLDQVDRVLFARPGPRSSLGRGDPLAQRAGPAGSARPGRPGRCASGRR